MSRPSTPDDEQPDPAVFWRWVWASVRPVLGYVFVGIGLILIEDLRRDAGRLDRLERAVADLHSVLLARADAPPLTADPLLRDGTAADSASSNGRGTSEQLLALTGGDSFHREACPLVDGKTTARRLTAVAAQRKGLRACPMCQPLAAGV